MDVLSARTLDRLPSAVARSRYDRSAVQTGIVHLGLGAFHRAHEAVFTETALAAGDNRWGILGVCMRAPDVRDALAPQDGLYTVASREGDREALQVIGVLTGLRVAPEDPAGLLAAMADPRVAIVSLTVTEKGYGLDPASGDLDESNPAIRRDLDNPARPSSAIGLLTAALAQRRADAVAPFTVLCCDNLASNGETLARLVRQFAGLRDPALARFIENEVAFPSTMLDRIVPATTEDDRKHVAERLGLIDRAPVIAEAHNRWVVEDRFPAGRPDWAAAGVDLVADVTPYETIKLKLLNASHSALAYLGYLAGHETIADATGDKTFRRFIEDMMDREVLPTLRPPPSVDAVGYRHEVIRRFANTAIRHRCWQIAMDGSQKLPPRLLGTIRDRLAVGAPFPRLALAVAGWMGYVNGADESGRAIDVRDPLGERLARVTQQAGREPGKLVAGLSAINEIFGNDLPQHPRFITEVTQALANLYALGAHRAVAETGDR
jgi:fructuronate reductase